MKKGFTLPELIAVITLLALLMLLVMPKVLNIQSEKQKDIDEAKLKLIYTAVDAYIENNIDEYPNSIGSTYCIELDKVDKENLISFDADDIIENTPYVKVKVAINDTKNYSLVKTCTVS